MSSPQAARSYPPELGVEWGKPPPADVLNRIPWGKSTAEEN